MSDIVIPDFSDPCAAYEQVRAAYYRVIAGGAPTWVEFGDRRVRYTDADVAGLEKLMGELKAECEAAHRQGSRKRYALRAGYRSGR